MSLRLYMDVHIEAAITSGLRARGIDALTAQEDGTSRYPDSDLLSRASDLGRVFCTRDEDFLVEAAARQRLGVPFVGVIYAHQIRVPPGRCVAEIALLAETEGSDARRNFVLYLPLKR